MDMNLNKLWKVVKGKEVWCAAVHEVAKSQTQLSDWKTKTINGNIYRFFLSSEKEMIEYFLVCPKEIDNREKKRMLLFKLYLILWELNKNTVKNISRDHQCWNNLEFVSQVRPKIRGTFNRK